VLVTSSAPVEKVSYAVIVIGQVGEEEAEKMELEDWVELVLETFYSFPSCCCF